MIHYRNVDIKIREQGGSVYQVIEEKYEEKKIRLYISQRIKRAMVRIYMYVNITKFSVGEKASLKKCSNVFMNTLW